ncbi:hypothetical protein P7V44_21700 [Providencia sp. CRE-3FA-0001]|uniref:Uncharacterized protein n=1 Tax=Providencia huashanensis TaxID=3037798 RepID=A0AA42FR12_9GAMM|nr:MULTISPECIES: hypothetical protein [unclassified Providencia]MDG4698842.1 hypothetical protein [Providencia sp. CRE-3FA-0001]
MATLTLRTKPKEDEQIEELKLFLNIKTASAAIIEAATDYKALSEEKDRLKQQLAEKARELEEVKQLIKQYRNAQQNLFDVL